MRLGPAAWRRAAAPPHRAARRRQRPARDAGPREAAAGAHEEAEMQLPAEIGDYTDFYASIHHATRVGSAVPARQSPAAELQVHSHRLSRPGFVDCGERNGDLQAVRADRSAQAGEPGFGPTRASWITSWRWASLWARAIDLGRAIPIAEAERHIFGAVPGERLVCARHSVVGVSAAGAVPGEELRHDDLSVGGSDGGAGSVPRAAP